MMDDQNGLLTSPKVAKFAVIFLGVTIAFLAVQMLVTLMSVNAPTQVPQSTIVVSGEGKASAAPDLATVSFTVSEDAATVAAAQDAAAKKTNAALAALKTFAIADKDVQTSSYNVYPKYSQPQPCVYNTGGVMVPESAGSASGSAIAMPIMPPCPASESKIVGYTASQTVTVKVRNLDSVGDVVTALGSAGISNLSGPNFTVENPDAIQAEARSLAIGDAKAKADMLAKDLGVRLIRVVGYSEGGGYYPAPMYAKAMAAGSTDNAQAVPSMPTGENQVTVDVTVTYEIR